LTGLVILSSGVWQEKFETQFSQFDTEILVGTYNENTPEDVELLFRHLNSLGSDNKVARYTGELEVTDGAVQTGIVTIIHNRSIAENVVVVDDSGAVFSGTMDVDEGSVASTGLTLSGESLLHSVPLTAKAFEKSFLGEYGSYAVTIGLVLFAFTTAIAWSYYGDRAVVYLVGTRWVTPYRILYVGGFFVATIVDTSLIWLISAVTVALMTLPNLVGISLMHKEIKTMTNDYWRRIKDPDS
jgi:AGCS family alanine or glycine:cation symporter